MVEEIRKLIEAYQELGYSDVQEFVKDAVRCRIIEIRRLLKEETKTEDNTEKENIQTTQRDRIAIIRNIVKELEDLTEWGAPEEDILEKAEKAGIDKEKAKEILEKLKQKGNLYCPRYGYYKVAGYD
jgi:replicative DNA helicase Mcm